MWLSPDVVVGKVNQIDLLPFDVDNDDLAVLEESEGINSIFIAFFPKYFSCGIDMDKVLLIVVVLAGDHEEGIIESGANLEDLLNRSLQFDIYAISE